MKTWSTACADWESRIINRESLVPCAPLFEDEAESALAVFKTLKIVDLPGMPTFGEVSRPWVFEFVKAIFGAYDSENGRRLINEFFLLISKKNTKALALDTLVVTPNGFKTIAAVDIGDEVIDNDGRTTRVTGKSPVFINRPCYEVEFSTGEKVVCDADHLWVTDAHADRAKAKYWAGEDKKAPRPSAKTAVEIANSMTIKSGKLLVNNHRTAICGSLDLPEAALPIAPYVLGAWLGDGASEGAIISCGIADAAHMEAQIAAVGQSVHIKNYRNRTDVRLSLSEGRGGEPRYRFRVAAQNLGVLGNKHIPQIYLRASAPQRLALLRGLMDTDGTISKAGQASFTTTTPALRDNVVELLNSLGLKAGVSETRAKLYGKDCGPVWRVQFWPFDETPVFTLQRKIERQRPRAGRYSPRSRTRQIVAVRSVASVPVQCLAIASETKQFLVTRSMIPTHNSTIAAGIMVTALIRNWRSYSELNILAPTIEVAQNSAGPAMGMVQNDEELLEILRPIPHLRTIEHRTTKAALKIVAADDETVSGKKSAFVLIDELWLFGKMARADNMLREATGGLTSRKEGFVIALSTMSDEPPAGVFKDWLTRFRNIRDGKIVAPRSLGVLYEYPDAMIKAKSYMDPANFYITNPNLGSSVDEQFILDQWEKDRQKGQQALASFYAKHLNVEIGMALHGDRWAGADFWERQTDKTLTKEELFRRSEVVVVGIDGGGLDDLFGLNLLGRDRETKDWLSWSHAWCHEGVLDRRKSIASVLRDFERSGELTIVGDELADISDIISVIEEVQDAGLLACVAVDPAGLGEFVDELAKIDITQEAKNLIGVPQGFRMMTALKTAERKLVNGTLWHCPSTLMAWAISNLKIEPLATAIRATKQNAGDAKVDPAFALFDSVTVMSLNPEAPQSVYDLLADADTEQTDVDEAQQRAADEEILRDHRHPKWQEARERYEARLSSTDEDSF